MFMLDDLAQAIQDVKTTYQNYDVQIATLNNDKITLQQQIDALNSNIAQLASGNAALQTQIDQLNTQYNTDKTELQSVIAGLKENPPITQNQIKAQRILGVALAHNDMRTPYVFNTTWEKNKSFDCSSFTQYCYRIGAGINLPRNKQYNYTGIEVKFGDLLPADLIFYDFPEGGTRDGITDHVGMYLGDGKMIHTNTPANGINIVDIATWNRSSLVKIWRIIQ